jgi:hypothetical protein
VQVEALPRTALGKVQKHLLRGAQEIGRSGGAGGDNRRSGRSEGSGTHPSG